MGVRKLATLFALTAASLSGCGKPDMVPAKGVIRLNGKPVEHCKVAFIPDTDEFNPDSHGYGFAVTDANGVYEIQHPSAGKGIYPGKYKVTFVLWVDMKGNPVPATAKPSEVPGGVKSLIPTLYESPTTTPEAVTVPAAGLERDFDLPSA